MKKDIDTFIKEQKFKYECEAIIDKDGLIEYAMPSHTEALIRETGESSDDIYKKMPITAAPIVWLVNYTGYISVWDDFYLKPKNCTVKQEESLKKLIKNKIISNKSLTNF